MAHEATNPIRDLELAQFIERQKKGLEVEHHRGQRPLEGFTRAKTTWTQEQDELAASEVYAEDEVKAKREEAAELAALDAAAPH